MHDSSIHAKMMWMHFLFEYVDVDMSEDQKGFVVDEILNCVTQSS